jgi:hypothetical protein
MDWTIFLWYVASLYALMLGCWMVVRACFQSPRARWCSLLVITAVITMPAANTALLLADPYLTPRSFSTPLLLIALANLLERRYAYAAIAALAACAIHPQMTLYFLILAGIIKYGQKAAPKVQEPVPVMVGGAAFLPFGFDLKPAQGPYREALYARDFFFLANWTWYDWMGLLAPLAFLWWWARARFRGTLPAFQRLSESLVPFGLLSIAIGLLFTTSHRLDTFARLQPLRCFHLITLIFVLLGAGLIGEYAAKGRPWVLAAFFLPMAGAMFFVSGQTYPHSARIEWPGQKTSSNDWVNALLWVRQNTPEDAIFAVDSRYFKDPAMDVHGFRTVSGRSDLADYFKDGGAVAMFPALAAQWKLESDATYGLNHFSEADFKRLSNEYPVTWTVIHGPAPDGLDCPYQQRGFDVCRIPGAPGLAHLSAAAQTPAQQSLVF